MSFDIDKVLQDMLGAVKDSVETDWEDIQGYARQVLDNEKDALADIAQMRLAGDLSDEEMESELADEKLTLESEFAAINEMGRASAQRAANAAVGVLMDAVAAAL
jgi:hypothetical protein